MANVKARFGDFTHERKTARSKYTVCGQLVAKHLNTDLPLNCPRCIREKSERG